jgi:hypothetical protein
MSVWTTRAHELVGLGDLVALSVLSYSDAVGHIAADDGDGEIRCVVVRGSAWPAGESVTVKEHQLLARVFC